MRATTDAIETTAAQKVLRWYHCFSLGFSGRPDEPENRGLTERERERELESERL
jgi:hypothetical protein